MKLYLQKNWSDQFGFEEAKSQNIFVGREREINSLKHVIKNNTSSTILVSSVRGIGKTSFVHRALSDIRSEVIPIFVNVGHTLRDNNKNKDSNTGRDFLISLIRASFLTDNFKNDREIEDLYHQSIGQFKKEKESMSNFSDEKKSSLLTQFTQTVTGDSTRLVLVGLAIALGSLGIFTEYVWLKILAFLSILSLPFSIGVKFEWGWSKLLQKINSTRDSYQIDNSAEYLETKFEQWLESKNDSKKIVFIIDELDKEDAQEALDAIKEYKNLFTRSFAHFIFICNQKAFAFTQQSRLDSKYPTLFSHVFYLPTSTPQEVSLYLDKVLSVTEPKKEIEDLKKFLLFKAANDFFSLKNLLNDLSEFDLEGEQYIDTETVARIDKYFSDAGKIYDYINCFYAYYSKIPKFFWRTNSDLQAEVFAFVNNNLMKDFTINLNDSENITKLVFLLRRAGALEERSLPDGISSSTDENIERYAWTGKYRDIKTLDELFSEDKDFMIAMKDLIRLANDLDDLTTGYENESFSEYDQIHEEQDGETLTGIGLFNVYKKHLDLFHNLENPADRIYARAEEAKEATKEVREAIVSVQKKMFDIFLNALGVILTTKNPNVVKTALSTNIDPNFAIKSWGTKFANRPNCLFHMTSPQKQLMVLKDIRDFGSSREVELAELRSNNNIIVLNFETENPVTKKHPSIKVDKAGRRRKPTDVTNFTTFPLPKDVRDLAKPLQTAARHF